MHFLSSYFYKGSLVRTSRVLGLISCLVIPHWNESQVGLAASPDAQPSAGHVPSHPTLDPSHTRRVHPTPPHSCVDTAAWKSRFCSQFLKLAILWTTLRFMGTHTNGMVHHLEDKPGQKSSACPGEGLEDA